MEKHGNKSEAAALRQKAEELLKNKPSKPNSKLSEVENLKLIHELQVHQIELEMQNEELRHVRAEAEVADDKYIRLYDFAPSGYFTLSSQGKIIELNLTGAKMLGKDRQYLKNSLFGFFVSENTKPIFSLFLEKAFNHKAKETCEVYLTTSGNQPLYVHLSGIASENGTQCMVTAVDITERRHTEKQLQDIIDKNPMSIQILDIDGYTIQTNSAHFNLFGAVVPQGYSLFQDPQLVQQGFGALFDRIKNGEVVSFPDSYFNAHDVDPSFPDIQVTIKATGFALINGNGIPEKIVLMQENITERKRAEENSKKQREILQRVFDNIPVMITYYNETAEIEMVNREIIKKLGWTFEEWKTENILAKSYPDPEAFKEVLDFMINKPIGWKDCKTTTKYGTVIDTTWTNISLPNGVSIGIGQDITERKNAEETHKQSEAALNYSQEIAKMGSWEFNLITGKVSWSKSYYLLLGQQPDGNELANDTFNKLVHPDDKHLLDEKLTEIYQNRKPASVDLRLILPDGQIKWVQNNIVPVFDGDTLIALKGVNIDITEKKQAETEILSLNSNLELKINERTRQLSEINEYLQEEIATRIQAETLLNQTRENYETFFNTIDDFLFVLNEQGNMIHTNETVTKRLGYKAEELLGESVLMVHPAERREEAGRIVGEMLAGTAEFCPVPLVTKAGKYISVETRVKPGFWDGKPVIFGVTKDVSKIKLSEEKFSKAFHTNSTLMAISSLDGVLIEVNDTFLETLGYKREEVIGNTSLELALFQDAELRNSITENLKQNIPVREVELDVRTKSGEIRFGLFSADTIYIGKELCLLTTMVDITDRKRSEEALKQSESRFSSFMDYLPAVVFLKDHEGRTLFVNKYMQDAFGAFAWLGKTMLEVFPNEIGEKLWTDDINSMQLGYQKFEESLAQLDGQLHLYETQKFTINRSGKEPWLGGISLDITERKRIEEEIIKSREEAEKANRAKSEFLSRMSHELRTPMNSILGFAQLMKMGELSLKQTKSVNHILNSGKYLLDLIDEVLDISRIESGRLSLLPEPVQLKGMIAEMMDNIQPLADARQVKLEFEISPANQLFIMADRKRIKQVLINLLNNAVKYNRQGGTVLIKTALMPQNDTDMVSVRISVTDTGFGIHPDDIPKLFVPFERIGAEIKQIEGTGLGLAVVKRIMDAMEGTFGVESIVGEGSTFWIEMQTTEKQISWKNQQQNNIKLTADLVIANKQIAFQNEEKADRAAELVVLKKRYSREAGTMVTGKTGTILYIEDNASSTELLEQILLDHRPSIHFVSSSKGAQTVSLAIEYAPDLILLDLDLPDMQGFEVIKLLQAEEKTMAIPVVVVSADAMPHQIENLMKAGSKDYLTKPLDIILFLQAVDEWVGK